MGLLQRFFGKKPTSVDDPVLGRLEFDQGAWSGVRVWSPGEAPIAVGVQRADAPPTEADRAAFQALVSAYPLLRTPLQHALEQLWGPASVGLGAGAPAFGSSLDLWHALALNGIVIQPGGEADLFFGFRSADHPPGAFVVSVRGGSVAPVEYVE